MFPFSLEIFHSIMLIELTIVMVPVFVLCRRSLKKPTRPDFKKFGKPVASLIDKKD